ncbi:MAG TPA: hypothetical protein V6C76_13510 [Drouetiella sp.]
MFPNQQHLHKLALALTLTCAAGFAVPVFAATTGAEIVAGIDKEHILAPGARVNARVDGQTVFLSTYRHTKANDTDLKIDAMLMSKAVMSIDPSITMVTVYFFSSSDLTKYKQLTVSSVSVKAFGSGAVGKDELINSLNLTAGTTADPADKLANTLAAGAGASGHRVASSISGSEITVSTDFESDASELELKIAALQLASEALQAAPDMKTVKVSFADLSQAGTSRQIVMDAGTVRSLNSALKNALSPVSIAVRGGGAAPVAASADGAMAGPMQDERQKLLNRINALGKNGVGIAPFLAAFKALEQQVADHATADTISDSVTRLSSNIDTQEKNYKEAKAKKASAPAVASGAGGGCEPKMPTKTRVGKWAAGLATIGELQANQITENTNQYIADIEAKLRAAQIPQKEKDEKLARTLQYFILTLSGNPAKTSELASMKHKLAAFQAMHPELNYD